MILAGPEILELINSGVIKGAAPEYINGSSLDVRIGDEALIENLNRSAIIDLSAKEQLDMERVKIPDAGMMIHPGEFFMVATQEVLDLPDDLSCEFKLRSSAGRAALNHALSGWADPGFYGTLTLEFQNVCQYHRLLVRPGMRLGQLVFHRHASAGEYSYRKRGRYNGQLAVTASMGVA
ncbi:dCTP deaminase [Cobetia sp. MMG027]|uniref:dCTP deaminase n=1 Tax=Cobetia sp. MMG027 TaxID=3021980 RepID=UPI0022FEE213|nr:dCTP deaminase [Cobetia sp. MMG027]MDA5564331.1 dCTP deaminase [Cobetia sp. MMG027]